MPHGMDADRASFIGNRSEDLWRVAFAQHDLRAATAIALAKALERIVQPDERCPAVGMVSGAVLVENEYRDHRPGLGCRMESRLVGHAQIASQPDYLNLRNTVPPPFGSSPTRLYASLPTQHTG